MKISLCSFQCLSSSKPIIYNCDSYVLFHIITDYGKRGQILSIPRHLALKNLLLPGLAIYASPENLNIYKDIIIAEDSIQYSSEIVRKVCTMFESKQLKFSSWIEFLVIGSIFINNFRTFTIDLHNFIFDILRCCLVSHDSAFLSS